MLCVSSGESCVSGGFKCYIPGRSGFLLCFCVSLLVLLVVFDEYILGFVSFFILLWLLYSR